ncbi:MAG TPA: S41 family peptidase [Thermoanaerobaculia bacterium]|nr:S41 family peptidase [Thermoanaerobaculia bacterium]
MLTFAALLFAWKLGGNRAPGTCAVDTKEDVVTLQCGVEGQGTFATAADSLPADEYRGKRVTIRGELLTERADNGASLWLRVDGEQGVLLLDNGQSDLLTGDSDWTPKSITLPVPSTAKKIVFGLLLRGSGTMHARNVRIETVEATGTTSKEAQNELDAAIAVIKKNALNRDKVDWKGVEQTARELALGAQKPAEVYAAIRYVLASLGDHHSFLMPPAAQKEMQEAKNPAIDVRVDDRIGYMNVPAYAGGEQTAARAHVRHAYDDLALNVKSAKCGWIVDLRDNGGGNMWPMLAALRPFLGDNAVGSFVPAESSSSRWFAKRDVDIAMPQTLRGLTSAKVAVLTSSRTASSGEAVVVAFRGRPNTRFFGEPTMGVSTSNEGYPLPDGASILLTTAVFADRNGKQYGAKIEPDEVASDALAAAKQWLHCD